MAGPAVLLVALWSAVVPVAAATTTTNTTTTPAQPVPLSGAGAERQEPAAEPLPPPPPPPPPPAELLTPPAPRGYGDAGSSELALGLGYSSNSGLLAAGGYRYFVWDGVAPGVEATYIGGGAFFSKVGLVLGALRLVPLRSRGVAVVLTGRAGRVFLADHQDGWAAGGGGGVIIFLGDAGNVGLEIGYEALRLLPRSFCADLRSCVLHGPVFGLRISF